MKPLAKELPDIHTGAELTARWEQLLEPLEFADRSLWLGWWSVGGQQQPVMMPVDDLPALPDPDLLPGLWQVVGQTLDEFAPYGHAGLVLTRPGAAHIDETDRAWLAALAETVRADPPLSWSLHVAAGGQVTGMRVPDRL